MTSNERATSPISSRAVSPIRMTGTSTCPAAVWWTASGRRCSATSSALRRRRRNGRTMDWATASAPSSAIASAIAISPASRSERSWAAPLRSSALWMTVERSWVSTVRCSSISVVLAVDRGLLDALHREHRLALHRGGEQASLLLVGVGDELVKRRLPLREQVGEVLELAEPEAPLDGDAVQRAAHLGGELLGAAQVGEGLHLLRELLVATAEGGLQVDSLELADQLRVLVEDRLLGERPPGDRGSQAAEPAQLHADGVELRPDRRARGAARPGDGGVEGCGRLVDGASLVAERAEGGVHHVGMLVRPALRGAEVALLLPGDHPGGEITLELQLVHQSGAGLLEAGELTAGAQALRVVQRRLDVDAGQHQQHESGDRQDRDQFGPDRPVPEPHRLEAGRLRAVFGQRGWAFLRRLHQTSQPLWSRDGPVSGGAGGVAAGFPTTARFRPVRLGNYTEIQDIV